MAEADDEPDVAACRDTKTSKTPKRRLPEWMNNVRVDKDHGPRKRKQGGSQQTPPSVDLPILQFTGNIVYCHQTDDCSLMCEDIMSNSTVGDSCILGFDIEWPVTYTAGREDKTALLQLCPSHNKCYLFHLSCMAGFPGGLKKLLETESIKKVGVGVQGDVWKLLRDFNVQVKGVLDLSNLANEKTGSAEIWSLDNLCKYVLKQRLDKDPGIRKSDWRHFPLTPKQQQYAAADAYAGLLLYNSLTKTSAEGGEDTNNRTST